MSDLGEKKTLALTNWPGISYVPLSSIYLEPPVQKMQGGLQAGLRMEIWGLFYRGCENQGTATDFAISEKSETRGEIFVY